MTVPLPLEGSEEEPTPPAPIAKFGAPIYVGTSGFKFADWKGPFYPETVKEKDWLSYYARRFNCLEINSSFYRLNNPATYRNMANKVPEGFEFTVKAYRTLTHESETDHAADFETFIASLEPLRELNKFGCVLAQFPTRFHNTPENRDYLAQFQQRFRELPLVVEFRSREWLDDEVLGFLREHQLGFCSVDEPQFRTLMPPVAIATSPVGYVRFHGRNYQTWWRQSEGKDRYDYHYSEEELKEWVPKIEALAAETKKAYVFMNNCFVGQAAMNALDMQRLLEEA
jgi:uncharacterized protein YecE (DUF72 family)